MKVLADDGRAVHVKGRLTVIFEGVEYYDDMGEGHEAELHVIATSEGVIYDVVDCETGEVALTGGQTVQEIAENLS